MTIENSYKVNGESLLEIDQLIISKYPYPIAVNYRRVLNADSWERLTREAIRVFEFTMRIITLGGLSQYLIVDRDILSDPELNRELYKNKLRSISLGTWVNYLFLVLKTYKGNRERFFLRELYDLYWDVSHSPLQPHKGIRPHFDSMVVLRNELVHKMEPKDDEGWEKLGRKVLENLQEVMRHFSFLQNYELIRGISRRSQDVHIFMQYTGEKPDFSLQSLQSNQSIEPGLFYLFSIERKKVLQLSPFIIYWENTSKSEQAIKDMVIFDGFSRDGVEYIATVVRELVVFHDESLTNQFRDLIYYNLEHVKMKQDEHALKDTPKVEDDAGWDVFISHAWEDKDSIARPLAKALEAKGLRVWFDEFTLRVGDRLSRSIDHGLASSKYGIVILSPYFFAKEWPQKELGGLVSREVDGSVVILPVWHNITASEIRRFSPTLADRVAAISSRGIDQIVADLIQAIRPV